MDDNTKRAVEHYFTQVGDALNTNPDGPFEVYIMVELRHVAKQTFEIISVHIEVVADEFGTVEQVCLFDNSVVFAIYCGHSNVANIANAKQFVRQHLVKQASTSLLPFKLWVLPTHTE